MHKRKPFIFVLLILSIIPLVSCSTGSEAADHPPQEIIKLPAPEQKDSMEMVYVSEGEFLMGSHKKELNANSNEKKQRSVYLDTFWIDQTEVTNTQYAMCVSDGDCSAPADEKDYRKNDMSNHPVVFVSWHDASNYCTWAGRRLPTEAEWEKSARGIYASRFPWGEDISCENANYYDCRDFVSTAPVGYYAETGSSVYGVYDMAGNVWEWMQDWYQGDFYSLASDENPININSESGLRILRGGSWNSYPDYLRSAHRDANKMDNSSEYIGFRCVLPEE